MEGFSWLLLLCTAMFFGAYLSGLVPVALSLSPSRLHTFSLFGAGLLVGTALIVIIPEGVHMHYAAIAKAGCPTAAVHEHTRRLHAPTTAGGEEAQQFPVDWDRLAELEFESSPPALPQLKVEGGSLRSSLELAPKGPTRVLRKVVSGARLRRKAPAEVGQDEESEGTNIHEEEEADHVHEQLETEATAEPEEHSGHDHGSETGHWQMGAALAFGFAFQVLVDRLSGGLHGHSHGGSQGEDNDDAVELEGESHGHAHSHGASIAAGGTAPATLTLHKTSSAAGGKRARAHSEDDHVGLSAASGSSGGGGGNSHSEDGVGAASSLGHSSVEIGMDRAPRAVATAVLHGASYNDAKSKSAMAGLVVHAIVDGVALGAAVSEGDSSLGLIVFAAIMLHKGPSALGLASYLMHSGMATAGVQTRLFIFSCAAPFGAIATYTLLSTHILATTQESLALCFLFSGGTFLYVATAHILPELQQRSSSTRGSGQDDDEDVSHASGNGKMSWKDVSVLICGVLLPLLLNMNHGH